MHYKARPHGSISGMHWSPTNVTLVIMLTLLILIFVLLFMTITAQTAQGQAYTVLHNFSGQADGANPWGTPLLDPQGNLYGTTSRGGNINGFVCGSYGCGTVYKLRRAGSGWILTTLYTFGVGGENDGSGPLGQLARDSSGLIYGTTVAGGQYEAWGGGGTLFKLTPQPRAPVSVMAPWMETQLWSFPSGSNMRPYSDLTMDSAGNLYGTTFGGVDWFGTIYVLAPPYNERSFYTLYRFTGGADSGKPYAGVVVGPDGMLYGTTSHSDVGAWCGVVYQMPPYQWAALTVLYTFTDGDDGCNPVAGVTFDQSGNLYGSTYTGRSRPGGVVFKLSPGNSGWTYSVIYSFAGTGGPRERLLIDSAGNLYGTTERDGPYNYGSVFKLTPVSGGWSYTSLHDFTGGKDGAYPEAGLVRDSNGNLYGAASAGGIFGGGVVFQIRP